MRDQIRYEDHGRTNHKIMKNAAGVAFQQFLFAFFVLFRFLYVFSSFTLALIKFFATSKSCDNIQFCLS